MNELNSYSFPLYGASLIEASAGTGKTYTIVNLYLRVLLGHTPRQRDHHQSAMHRAASMGVDRILVVTFTNAATAELRERIRARIQQAYLDFYRGSSGDEFTQQLIDDCDDLEWACEILSLAAKQMDEASIFTIHSFCQKMLSEHAFESGSVFDETLELDQSGWIKQATQDYWRKVVVNLPETLLKQIMITWPSPDSLEKQLFSLVNRNVTPVKVTDWNTVHQAIDVLHGLTHDLKRWWKNSEVAEQLQQAKLKGNTKLGKPPIYQMMAQFCQSDELTCPLVGGWSELFPEKIEKARSKTSSDLSHLDFSRFESLDRQTAIVNHAIQSALLNDALDSVRKNLDAFKRQTSQLSPDDLLSRLQHALLLPSSKLASLIQSQYPVAMIDEFQDTDEVQFDVFSTIYPMSLSDECQHCVVMIGDPKQAIYGFRGADIYTYIRAKRLIHSERHFTLGKNWRTQGRLVDCVNQLFEKSEQAFLLNTDIPFQPVTPARPEATLKLGDAAQPCLDFYVATGDQDIISNNDAKSILAIQATNVIVDLLRSGSISYEDNQGDLIAVASGDICVLVRDRTEAQLMKQTLSQANIDSVFLARQSVFASNTAMDIYRLLLALASPNDDRKMRAAVLSAVLCLDAHQLDSLFNDELAWQQLVGRFVEWRTSWQKHGVMMALNQVMQYFDVFSLVLQRYSDGLRQLTDLRHLIEILQHQASVTPGESQLCYWFWQHINDPDDNNEAQQLRLETDSDLVQIVTMHASKGLEFPFVFIPFACTHRPSDSAIYHGDDNRLYVDFEYSQDSLDSADYERLAEDIRLFYVAITRAVYYCFVGSWNPQFGKRKSLSALRNTALGSLTLRQGDEPTTQALLAHFQTLGHANSGVSATRVNRDVALSVYTQGTTQETPRFSHQTLENEIDRSWRITSYSAIARNQFEIEHGLEQNDERLVTNRQIDAELTEYQEVSGEESTELVERDRFNFVRGAQAGSFLHGVLENIDFTQPQQLINVIEQQGQWFGIDEAWFETVKHWLEDVLTTPMLLPGAEPASNFCLNQLGQDAICPEMEFHLPLHHVSEVRFNAIINSIFKTIERRYDFQQLHGMLKGFIDLTFCINGQFFVADYKSNHLGDDFQSYSERQMEVAMQDHDYHLQSLLYVLALHRYLSIKLTNYDYDKHVGGAYYWFIRGMSASAVANNGVYFYKPSKSAILQLDSLFSGNQDTPKNEPMEQLGLW